MSRKVIPVTAHVEVEWREEEQIKRGELLFRGEFSPYRSGVAYGPPESCYPDEGGELEYIDDEVVFSHDDTVETISYSNAVELTAAQFFGELDTAEEEIQRALEDAFEEHLQNYNAYEGY